MTKTDPIPLTIFQSMSSFLPYFAGAMLFNGTSREKQAPL